MNKVYIIPAAYNYNHDVYVSRKLLDLLLKFKVITNARHFVTTTKHLMEERFREDTTGL